MKPNLLIRLVVLFMVPCLTMNPVLVSAWGDPLNQRSTLMPDLSRECFQEEAVVQALVGGQYHWLQPLRDRLTVIGLMVEQAEPSERMKPLRVPLSLEIFGPDPSSKLKHEMFHDSPLKDDIVINVEDHSKNALAFHMRFKSYSGTISLAGNGDTLTKCIINPRSTPDSRELLRAILAWAKERRFRSAQFFIETLESKPKLQAFFQKWSIDPIETPYKMALGINEYFMPSEVLTIDLAKLSLNPPTAPTILRPLEPAPSILKPMAGLRSGPLWGDEIIDPSEGNRRSFQELVAAFERALSPLVGIALPAIELIRTAFHNNQNEKAIFQWIAEVKKWRLISLASIFFDDEYLKLRTYETASGGICGIVTKALCDAAYRLRLPIQEEETAIDKGEHVYGVFWPDCD